MRNNALDNFQIVMKIVPYILIQALSVILAITVLTILYSFLEGLPLCISDRAQQRGQENCQYNYITAEAIEHFQNF